MSTMKCVPSGWNHLLPLVILLLSVYCQTAHTLECYKCSSIEYMRGSSKNKMEGKSDPNCENAGSIFGTKTESCVPGFKCGLLKGESSGNVPFAGKTTISVLTRGCMPGLSDGCVSEVDALKSTVNAALGFLSVLGGWQIDGKACYCSSNRCIAGGCASGWVPIAGQCFAWYMIIGMVVGAIVALLLLTCCCCCCCCTCCKSSKPGQQIQTVVVQQPPQLNPYANKY